QRRGRTRRRGDRQRSGIHRRDGAPRSAPRVVPRRLLPVPRGCGQGLVRGPEVVGRARRRLHPPRSGPPSGPPARRRAHVEHLPPPPDPRIRGSEVRRRPRQPERLRPTRRGSRGEEDGAASPAIRQPVVAPLVRRGGLPRAAAAARHGGRAADALRGGVLRPEARARPMSEQDAPASRGAAMFELARELFPLPRSLTGDGVRRTLELVGERIALVVTELPSGTPVYDCVVPPEWNVWDAWSVAEAGRR